MASAQVHPGNLGYGNGHHRGQPTKPRSRTGVKPILKKLHSHSHSDRDSSLDLDSGWDDQPSPGLPGGNGFGSYGNYDGGALYDYSASGNYASRSTRDLGHSLSNNNLNADLGIGSGAVAHAKYSHGRSLSGASHASSVATTASGRNGGSFVHPFQQTPQAPTPSLSFTNSRRSLDNTIAVGTVASSTIDEYGVIDPYASFHSTSTSNTTSRAPLYAPSFHQHPRHRQPSVAPQPTISPSDGARIGAVHTNSGLSQPTTGSSLQHLATASTPHLDEGWSSTGIDSPLSSTAPFGTATTTLSSTPAMGFTSSSAATASPLGSSLDMGSFRLRSRSEVDSATRQEQIREARRKFDAKEKAKEEKHAREQLRRREKAESKEANRHAKPHARLRKGSVEHGSGSTSTKSSGTDLQIPAARAAMAKIRRSDGQGGKFDVMREKPDFSSHGYETAGHGKVPRADGVQFKSRKRAKNAKHQTAGVWTVFMLWVRTRLFKMRRR